LEEYVKNMKEWQSDVYFIAGESIDAVKKSPFLEVANRKKVQVLFLVDPIDECKSFVIGAHVLIMLHKATRLLISCHIGWSCLITIDAFQHLADFDGHKLQSLTKEGLKFGDEDEDTIKKRAKAYKETFKPLTKFLKETLTGKVAKVVVSQRVENSPSVIVTSQYGHTANMERIMRAQTFSSPEQLKAIAASRTLELNPRHPIIIELNKIVVESPDSETTKDLVSLVYDTALLTSGFTQDDPENFAARMYRTIGNTLNVKSFELVDEIEIEEEEEEEEETSSSSSSSSTSSAPEDEGHDEF
jgi:HSP90 family molecular chaperone